MAMVGWKLDKQVNRQTDRETDSLRDRQTETDRLTETDRQTVWRHTENISLEKSILEFSSSKWQKDKWDIMYSFIRQESAKWKRKNPTKLINIHKPIQIIEKLEDFKNRSKFETSFNT